MKKSEIKLIICGIASLVISVILAVATVIVFFANLASLGLKENIVEGFNTLQESVESVTGDIDVSTDVDVEI